MASLRQIESDRSNALRSTGPKTETGKRAELIKRSSAWINR